MIERKSFGMLTRCGVCAQRGACRRQSRKWFGRECRETGERSIQDTQKLRQRTGTVAKLMRNLVCCLGSRDIVQTSSHGSVGRPVSGSQEDAGADQWWCLEKEFW